jgi:RNA polymerase sigma-70 factor (ECF subfamily)
LGPAGRRARHAGWVESLARSLIVDQDEVDEVVQDTWLSALRHRHRHELNLRSWLARIVKNSMRQRSRTCRRFERREQEIAVPDELPSTVDLLRVKELRRDVRKAVLNLPEPTRSTVLFHYHEGLSSKAIAARHGVAEGTVRSRLSRGLQQLCAALEARYGRESLSWMLVAIAVGDTGIKPSAPPPELSGTSVLAAKGLLTVAMVFCAAVGGTFAWLLFQGATRPLNAGSQASPLVAAAATTPQQGPPARSEMTAAADKTPASPSGTPGLPPDLTCSIEVALDPTNAVALSQLRYVEDGSGFACESGYWEAWWEYNQAQVLSSEGLTAPKFLGQPLMRQALLNDLLVILRSGETTAKRMATIALTTFSDDHPGLVRAALLDPAVQDDPRIRPFAQMAHALIDSDESHRDLQEFFECTRAEATEEMRTDLALAWISRAGTGPSGEQVPAEVAELLFAAVMIPRQSRGLSVGEPLKAA